MIAIVALLISLLVPALAKARTLAKRVACSADLRTLGAAATLYGAEFTPHVPVCRSSLEPNLTHP